MTLGSLFDGSGGFPLAGAIHGIKPVWASEIEPYPIRVTKTRFPDMEHLGSVLDVEGDKIAPVEIITFGSPCQDLSVAGKQKGIHEGERSSLFFEAVRIAKEMRAHDRAIGRTGVDVRPRFLVWENVPGAFSSHQGEDFRAVLEALGGIAQDGVSIPRPPKGKWDHAGCVVGDGWSIAWRLYDAQYWGVPQRRKRIYLVADLASERAGEILFERESLCGNPAEGGEAREGIAHDVPGGVGGGCGVKCLNPWDAQSIRQYDADGIYPTLNANATGGLNRQGVVAHNAPGGAGGGCTAFHLQQDPINGNVSPCIGGQHQATVGVVASFKGGQGPKAGSIGWQEEQSPTLTSANSGTNTVPDVVYQRAFDITGTSSNSMKPPTPDSCFRERTIGRTIDTFVGQPECNQGGTVVVEAAGFSDALGENAQGGMGHTVEGSPALRAGDVRSVVYDCRGNGDGFHVPTLTGDHGNRVTDYTEVSVHDMRAFGDYGNGETGRTLKARDYKDATDLIVGQSGRKYIVRRLTPLECCRLQGFPDWWEDGVEGSDSARYKMWGNGIALPCAADVLGRIARESQRNKEK